MEKVMAEFKRARKPGRPKAIPLEMEGVVVELYRQGYGYRAITRILKKEHGLNPHYSSVRKTLIRLGEVCRG
jgi:transposase